MIIVNLLLVGGYGLAGAVQSPPAPAVQVETRIGVISGPLGSFAATILPSLQLDFDKLSDSSVADDLSHYDVLVVDNLYRLQDLNGDAFRDYVKKGGVLIVLNPKTDGFSRTWTPFDVFVGPPSREGRIVEKKHPLFESFRDDKLKDFAESNGPYVGNCSFTEPAKEWKILARDKDKKNNALILEADYGRGRIILACVVFNHYNARVGPTRLGENLFRYAIKTSEGIRAKRSP